MERISVGDNERLQIRMSDRDPEKNSLLGEDKPFQPIRSVDDEEEEIENVDVVEATFEPSMYADRMFEEDVQFDDEEGEPEQVNAM